MTRGGKVSAKRLSFVFLEELGKIRRRRIESAGRSHCDVPVHLASGTSVMQLAQGKMKADAPIQGHFGGELLLMTQNYNERLHFLPAGEERGRSSIAASRL